MRLPAPRGPVSRLLGEHLLAPPGTGLPAAQVEGALAAGAAGRHTAGPVAALADEDLQLALCVCYELHYRGFAGVDERWEWAPSLLALRARLEDRFESALRALVPPRAPADPVTEQVRALVDGDDGPALSAHAQREATLGQFREFAVHRSIYQLKEADPHSWGIPRLSGASKAALVEIQYDEYGGGRPERMHAHLFARTLRELDLDDSYGAYLDLVPAPTLATVNLVSFFGLHRRWRGALLGHLAAFEMTSSGPNRRYGNALRRLGFGATATHFYDEHVEADAVHEQVALVDLCGSFAAAEPLRAPDVVFGAACCLELEARFAGHLLQAWARGDSSLRAPVPAALPVPA